MTLRSALALLIAPALLLPAVPAQAQLDLARAGITRLDNGLTVIVLEENSLPVVSVQVLYKSGSRDETSGKTGLAHMLEHLAFRASENFPDGSATDTVYDAGGEWHGYTWIDQTTYFATAPAEKLDLLLAIEADRMARVTIDPAAMEAEAGAVITEMRGYQNDPSTVLFDAVVASAIQAHPYRNNTIGYESDVAALTAQDAEDYYARHYAPENAVLAIVGNVDPQAALAQARAYFDELAAREAAPRVVSVEPPQAGLRRVNLAGPVERQYLRIAYPAPAASSADFAPFLLMQQLLSGGSGVNFRQNDWGTPAADGSVLAGAVDDMASWFIPTADPYLFMLSASLDTASDRSELERELESRIAAFRSAAPSVAALDAARAAVRAQLAFDLETTEDAAHQLAFFEGIGALEQLLALDDALARTMPNDIRRAAQAYLDPARRTIGWYGPGSAPGALATASGNLSPSAQRPAVRDVGTAASPAQLRHLPSGLPVILRPVSQSPLASVMLVQSGARLGLEGSPDGIGVAQASGLAADLPRLVAQAAAALREASPPSAEEPSNDPSTRLGQMLAAQRDGSSSSAGPTGGIAFAVVSGAVDTDSAYAALASELGTASPAALPSPARFRPGRNGMGMEKALIPLPLAQSAIGYSVAAPAPASREGLAWRMLLYVLTHDYGGRLGDAAISERGLVYYIGSDYIGDAAQGRIEITAGVDPGKIDAFEAMLRDHIAQLSTQPPGAAEIAAARAHILGREASAAMDNQEIATSLARHFLTSGGLSDNAALSRQLAAIGSEDLARAARGFANGTILRVDVTPAPEGDD
ncbi:hypothetical protein GCM10009127_13000 [Alteraurantiacibacter aestuarii]|uniref:Insulinase family protein n=1 Tax=Alteraurantiacibacter aestuarii TaxID=650004 RepID=A0A844ZHY6_9SPHN|nr:M16 family metallopeptidase [Alteraurantiacibacter aestuarii]MXO88111.1 hypothetical protein [Alteraurantiacibacter aestuarii]